MVYRPQSSSPPRRHAHRIKGKYIVFWKCIDLARVLTASGPRSVNDDGAGGLTTRFVR